MYAVQTGGVAPWGHDLEIVQRGLKPGLLQLSHDHLCETTDALNRTAIMVETYWDDFPEPVRRLLKLYVYAGLGEQLKARSVIRHPRTFLLAVWIATRLVLGFAPTAIAFIEARKRLEEAVLAAVERENPTFQARVSEALANLPTSSENGLTASQYMRRLRELPDTAG